MNQVEGTCRLYNVIIQQFVTVILYKQWFLGWNSAGKGMGM